jgi:hypothetical protein
MKRFTIFSFLWSMMMFQNYIVDNDGAGGGDDNTDIGDIDINDDDIDNNNDDTDKKADENQHNNDNDSKSDIETLKKELEELKADKEQRESEIAINHAIKELSQKHQGFDSEKIKGYLIELNKTNPEKANMLNNPVGWENIWLNEFATANVNNDSPSFGRNVAPVDRSEEVLEKVKSGEWLSVDDELEIYGKHL